jgi:hypothetical protein
MNATIGHSTTSDNEQNPSRGSLGQELEFLWKDDGQSGKAYDLYWGRISRNPIVGSQTTGKYFMFTWSEIIESAVKNGLDEK